VLPGPASELVVGLDRALRELVRVERGLDRVRAGGWSRRLVAAGRRLEAANGAGEGAAEARAEYERLAGLAEARLKRLRFRAEVLWRVAECFDGPPPGEAKAVVRRDWSGERGVAFRMRAGCCGRSGCRLEVRQVLAAVRGRVVRCRWCGGCGTGGVRPSPPGFRSFYQFIYLKQLVIMCPEWTTGSDRRVRVRCPILVSGSTG
jgi:hypothetical protein